MPPGLEASGTVARLERQRPWDAAGAREGAEGNKEPDFLPPPARQPPSRGENQQEAGDEADAVCRGQSGFLGPRAGWKMDQREGAAHPGTLPGGRGGGGVGDASEPPARGYRMALPSPTSFHLQNSEDLDKISFLLAI